jgi:hypothetical protein
MEFVHFACEDIWHFIGCLLLISAGCSGLAQIIRAVRG